MAENDSDKKREKSTSAQQSSIDWSAVALQFSMTALTGVISGFAMAAGAHAFSRLVAKTSKASELGDVIPLRKNG